VAEEPFEVEIAGGVLRGHRGGEGPSALLLHGGPAVGDYTGGAARELGELFHTFRYTQRGTLPSNGDPPYEIESHMADALAVLDYFGIDRAWAVGHSWGAHLALHLLVAHPERLLGVVCIAALGAFDVFREQDANLRRGLTDAQVARVVEIEDARRRGEATEADLVERFALLWPQFFADREHAPPSLIEHVGARCSAETNFSIADHLRRGTLVHGLPRTRLPALFVHGTLDALPVRSASDTAALIPGAIIATIEGCGHFPWLECPGELRRRGAAPPEERRVTRVAGSITP
jgi:proline iminopeptidase